ncbi:MAG: hypothetical protein FVQ83_09435 [Chloroflexi bacterium]|nr:hypothetical protein [Chloroflexota bacterium]
MSEPFKLFRLQQVDSQIDQTKSRLTEIENTLKDETELSLAQRNFEETEKKLVTAQKGLKRSEDEVEAVQIKIELNQSNLYGGKVTNPKELQDLQQEAAAHKRYLTTLEDKLLEKMVALEDAESGYEASQTRLEDTQKLIAERNKALTIEQANLLKDLERLIGERQAAIPSIPSDDLELYEKLRAKRAGVAVAKVKDKTCTACGAVLPHALAQASRSPNKISRCETCGRILYSR